MDGTVAGLSSGGGWIGQTEGGIRLDPAGTASACRDYRSHHQVRREPFPQPGAMGAPVPRMARLIDDSKRGVWNLTPLGWNDPFRCCFGARRISRSREVCQAGRKGVVPTAGGIEADIQEALPLDEAQDRTLLEVLRTLPPYGFELLCERLLHEHGFEDVQVTQKSRDGGLMATASCALVLSSASRWPSRRSATRTWSRGPQWVNFTMRCRVAPRRAYSSLQGGSPRMRRPKRHALA